MATGEGALDNDTRRIQLADVYKLVLDQSGKQIQSVLGNALDKSDEERRVAMYSISNLEEPVTGTCLSQAELRQPAHSDRHACSPHANLGCATKPPLPVSTNADLHRMRHRAAELRS
jgi:hypothetical protein